MQECSRCREITFLDAKLCPYCSYYLPASMCYAGQYRASPAKGKGLGLLVQRFRATPPPITPHIPQMKIRYSRSKYGMEYSMES